MSFSNPLQLSGRQLENYNNTQRALENIKGPDSSQQQQLFSQQPKQQQQQQQYQSSEQKSMPQFGVANQQTFSDGKQSNVLASQRQNAFQQKQVSFSENSGFKIDPAQPAKTEQQSKAQPQSQGFQNTPGSTPQGESRVLFNGNQQRSTRRQDNPEDAISELVHHSDKTIRQLEDQFKSLNAGSSGNQRGFSQDKSNTPVSKLNGAKIQHIKSEVDRLIMQAEIQNKQNNLGVQNNNNRDSRYSAGINNYDPRGRDFSGSRREESSSPRKHKRNERSKSSKKSHSKKKDHHRSRKGKHSKREYNSDDTSSYSGESDSVIMEQENESNFDDSSNEENYDEDDRKQRKHNKHKHSKHHQGQSNSDTKSYLQELEARSLSNYSKNPSQQQRKRTPSNHSLRLDKDNLKKLPSYGLPPMNKGENSVYSSASRMRQAQAGQEGFRRCPEENENNNRQHQNYQENRAPKQGKNHRNEEKLDDSFDIHEDFQVYNSNNRQGNIKSSRVSGIERPSKQAGNERNQMIAQSAHRRAAATSDEDDEEDLYKPYVAPEKSNYSQKVATQQVRKDISARAYEQQRQTASYPDQSELALGLAAMEEDSVIFCVNCEEYIKADKVDEHSNICQSNKDNRACSQREYIQNINEKLTKIRYLIKSKHNHLLSFSRNTTSQQELGLFQSALELISVSIDNEIQVSQLTKLISDLKEINKCLARSSDTSQHSLLYLSQKGIEFIQRKSEFLSRYGNDKFDADDGALSYIAPSEHSVPNNRNFDEVSYASSTIRQGTNISKQKRNPIQIFSQIDNDLNIFKPKQQQQNRYGEVMMSPPQKGNGFNENSNQYLSPKSNYSTQNEAANRQERMYQKAQETHEQQGQNVHNYVQQNQQQQYYQQQQQQQQQSEPLRNFNRQQNSHPFSVRGQQPQVFTVEEKYNRQQLPEQNQRLRQQQEQQQNVSQPFQMNPPRQQQPFSQKAPTFLEPVETVTVKEAQISRPSNQRNSYLPSQQIGLNRQMNQDASNLSSLGAQKQRFFQLAHSLKPHYPSSNKFLIAELWNDAQKNNITENNWNQFLISKFS